MHKLYKILLAVLTIALFGHSLIAEQAVIEISSVVVTSTAEDSSHNTHPLAQSNLQNVYLPVESGIDILSNTPVPYLSGEDQEGSAVQKFVISAAENESIEFLRQYESVNRDANYLKLIFPFHAFL